MRLYSGHTRQFLDDAVHNRIAESLKTAFCSSYGFNPSPAECSAWHNSLRAMSQVVDFFDIMINIACLSVGPDLTDVRRLFCTDSTIFCCSLSSL